MRCDRVALIDNRPVAPRVHALRVPFAGSVLPGQFFMLKPERAPVLLPRAISVSDYDGEVLTLLVQQVGRGTEALSAMRGGDALTLTGPLGNGFPVEELGGRIALVGGGIGVAPLLYTARALADRGVPAEACLGFRSDPFLVDRFQTCCGQVSVATEDGSAGLRGYVTALLDPQRYEAVLCCGPEPMMRAVVTLCGRTGTPVFISMENRMACGIGACLVCTCADREGHNRRACLDGPVFRGEEVDFDA